MFHRQYLVLESEVCGNLYTFAGGESVANIYCKTKYYKMKTKRERVLTAVIARFIKLEYEYDPCVFNAKLSTRKEKIWNGYTGF